MDADRYRQNGLDTIAMAARAVGPDLSPEVVERIWYFLNQNDVIPPFDPFDFWWWRLRAAFWSWRYRMAGGWFRPHWHLSYAMQRGQCWRGHYEDGVSPHDAIIEDSSYQ